MLHWPHYFSQISSAIKFLGFVIVIYVVKTKRHYKITNGGSYHYCKMGDKTCFGALLQNELVNRDVVRLTTHDLNLARNQKVVASWE